MGPRSNYGKISRRAVLGSSALAPLALGAQGPRAALGPPPYTLSINIEIMFPREMPRAERMKVVASQGITAFSFWRASEEEQRAMLEVQQKTGLKCASIVGSGPTGRTTGLTRPGAEKQYLDELTAGVKMGQRFGGADAIIFLGRNHADVPWETQRRNIVSGLRKAGDIGQEYGVHLVFEPLNRVESPEIAVLTAAEAFPIIEEVAHPYVKVDFDMYHLQLSEGNLTNNLQLGLQKGLIRLVQVGDVPGRKEPGTGEVNYVHIFRMLRQLGYKGYVDSEHGTSSTPEHAIQVVKRLSMEN